MSSPPRRSSRLSSAAAAPSAAAAQSSSPATGSKRRADNAEAKSTSTDTSTDADASAMSDDAALSTIPPLAPQSAPSAGAAAVPSSSAAASARKRSKGLQAVGAALASPATIATPSRWSHLYSDALHSILQFASLAELGRVLRVSRRWSEAVTTMPPIHAESGMEDVLNLPVSRSQTRHRGQSLLERLRSRLARHVSSFGFQAEIPSLAHLQLIAQCMPWLQQILIKPTGLLTDFCATILTFKDLRTLNLTDARLTTAESALVVTVSQLPKLETLELGLSRFGISDVCFAPLTALQSLRTLELKCRGASEPASDAQIAQLRALPAVTELFVWSQNYDPTFFPRMLQPGHALKWTEFAHQDLWATGKPIAVTEQLAPLLGSVPSLERVTITLQCSNLSFFSHLPHLTRLVLGDAAVPGSELVAAVSKCTQMRYLFLEHCRTLTSAHLEQLFASFHHLESIFLQDSPLVDSLRWLAIPSVRASLSDVTLRELPACAPAEAAHLLSLQSIKTLGLRLAEPISAELRAKIDARFPRIWSFVGY